MFMNKLKWQIRHEKPHIFGSCALHTGLVSPNKVHKNNSCGLVRGENSKGKCRWHNSGAVVPQADIVLQCKLDPINNLRKLWHHCQQGDAKKVLHQVQRNTLIETSPSPRVLTTHSPFVSKTRFVVLPFYGAIELWKYLALYGYYGNYGNFSFLPVIVINFPGIDFYQTWRTSEEKNLNLHSS